MKQIYKYMMLPLVGLMTACAEKGPFEVGEYNVNIEVTKLTATTALIKIAAPQSDKQLIKSFKSLKLKQAGDNANSNYVYFDPITGTGDYWYTEATYLATNLKPSTKYDISLRVEPQGDDYDYYYYDTRTSLTTLAEGDYKAIGLTPTYQIDYDNNEATVTVTLPAEFSAPYHNLDLEYTPATGTPQWQVAYSYDFTSDRVISYLMGGLQPNTTYKLRLHGDIDYQVLPAWSVTLEDIYVPFDTPLTTGTPDE